MYRPSQTPHLNLSSVGQRGWTRITNETPQCEDTRLTREGSTCAHKDERTRSRAQTLCRSFWYISPDNRVEYGDERSSGISLVGCRTRRRTSHLCCTSDVSVQIQTRVKLNRVFFPRCVHASPFPCLLVHQTVDIPRVHDSSELAARCKSRLGQRQCTATRYDNTQASVNTARIWNMHPPTARPSQPSLTRRSQAAVRVRRKHRSVSDYNSCARYVFRLKDRLPEKPDLTRPSEPILFPKLRI